MVDELTGKEEKEEQLSWANSVIVRHTGTVCQNQSVPPQSTDPRPKNLLF